MKDNYDFSSAKNNPYIQRLEALISDAILSVDNNLGMPSAKQMAEYLAARNVTIVSDVAHGQEPAVGDVVVRLPVPIGTTLYRIDVWQKKCSYHHEHRDNLYYCVNDWKCKHLCDGDCDAGKEYKLFTIANADAMAILGNAKLFGTNRIFLDKEEAEKEVERLNAEEKEEMKKRGVELPAHYEGMRKDWDEYCEDED